MDACAILCFGGIHCDGRCSCVRRVVEPDRACFAAGSAAAFPVSRAAAHAQPCLSDGDSFRSEDGHPVGGPAPRDGLRFGHDLLAPASRLAARGCVERTACRPARSPARRGPYRLVACGCRLRQSSQRGGGGKKAVPIPRTGANRGANITSSPTPRGCHWRPFSRRPTSTTSRNSKRFLTRSRPCGANGALRVSNPHRCRPTAPTTAGRFAEDCANAASNLCWPNATRPTAAAWAKRDGSSNEHWRGCTSTAVFASDTNGAPISTRRSFIWAARSSASSNSKTHSVRRS